MDHLLNQIGHMKKPFSQKSVFMKNLQLYFGTIIFYSNNLNYEILKIIKKTIERHSNYILILRTILSMKFGTLL